MTLDGVRVVKGINYSFGVRVYTWCADRLYTYILILLKSAILH